MTTVSPMYFQLVSWRLALKLERDGMKHSCGKTLRPHLKKALNLKLKLSASHNQYIEEIQKIIDRIKAGEEYKLGD